EQGALPRAVRADEGDLVPRVEEEVRVLEDERGAPGFPEVPARDDRLHVPGASPWSPMRLRSAPVDGARDVRRSSYIATDDLSPRTAFAHLTIQGPARRQLSPWPHP